ncbi:cation:proton antiporter [Lamprocystis purpurea]|uniref:cation:proton antiporter n=1 Tax=Lamprocystis purpurea TaxID=61598 RepID=UPI001FDEAA0A|nr:cation:proton antiporter [Lamprocystis purpurea]
MEHLAQILMLLSVAVAVVLAFQQVHIPTSLGYLLVGVILGPHTAGPTVHVPEFEALAEFGVVFLLFTIGLNFSLPQLHALRHQVLGLGTAQVGFTTAVVGIIVWLAGLPAAAAFVIGAVFAQSSTTIIGSQLAEQGEDNSPHGRLGLALSVFQDIMAVPFLVVIPVLGAAVGAGVLAGALGWAMIKAVAAFALVFFVGRWLLRPLFHLVAKRRSAELFTLAVLLVALLAAWTTSSLGLSLAFGAFLAGMMLGETEFRHRTAPGPDRTDLSALRHDRGRPADSLQPGYCDTLGRPRPGPDARGHRAVTASADTAGLDRRLWTRRTRHRDPAAKQRRSIHGL